MGIAELIGLLKIGGILAVLGVLFYFLTKYGRYKEKKGYTQGVKDTKKTWEDEKRELYYEVIRQFGNEAGQKIIKIAKKGAKVL